MKLKDILHRQLPPIPWAEGEKIPWNDPAFSQRMLQEHLSQEHDAASRRSEKIDQHVQWIHQVVLRSQRSNILDLGCGPGLYTSRLAESGHSCMGIDFSPASIAYARQQAKTRDLGCTYLESDLRQADFGRGYDLVMFIFGELNVFQINDARLILNKAYQALKPGARLLLEVHTSHAIQAIGQQSASWYSTEYGLFSDRPHLCLYESDWNAPRKVATERYFIVDLTTNNVTRFAASIQAYSDDEYHSLLSQCGFGSVENFPSLYGCPDETQPDLFVLVSQKPDDSHQMPGNNR